MSGSRLLEFTSDGRPVYLIDGTKVHRLEDFYREIGAAINGPGGYFGENLDALDDCLNGGFGSPDEGGYIIRWAHAEASRHALGYEETVRQLADRYLHEHESWHEETLQKIEDAKRHVGPTVFDWLVEIFTDAKERGVELQLR